MTFPVGVSDYDLLAIKGERSLIELAVAKTRIDTAARAVYEQNALDVGAGLVLVLAMTTGVIVFATTLQSLSWYAATGLGVASSLLISLILFFRNIHAWNKEHPLLLDVFRTRIMRGASAYLSQEALQVCVDVVRRYLPKAIGQMLLNELDEAQRAVEEASRAPDCRYWD